MQDRRGARQQESEGVGQERCGRGAVAVEGTLDRLDSVFASPPCAVEVFIHLGGRRRLAGGDDKAGVVPSRHAFGFDEHPPRRRPRGGGIGELFIHPAAGGRWRAIRLCEGGALLVESAGRLQHGDGVAEQDRLAGQAKDESAVAPMGEHLNDRWGGARTVPADEDRRPWPGAPQSGQEPDHTPRVFCTDRAPPRTEAGGHQGMRGPGENAERHGARALVVMVIAGERLLLRWAKRSRRGGR
jgi:hypothetical protein